MGQSEGLIGRRRAWAAALLILLGLAGLAALWRFTALADLLTADRILGWARLVGETRWAPLALIALYTPAAFFMFPRPVLTILAVLAFGAWLGFFYAMTGILLSALVAYYAGRLVDPAAIERLAGRYFKRVKAMLDRHGLLAVFLMRVVPTAPHVVESALAGALRVKAWQFCAGTFLGMLPGVAVTSIFGGEAAIALEEPAKVNYWLPALGIALIGVTIWLARRWARQ